jgi:uncharacterized membrane protein YhaH (DUF805 family)
LPHASFYKVSLEYNDRVLNIIAVAVFLYSIKIVEGGLLMDWYLKVVKNYVGFQGRARRKEYWMFFLFNVIIGFVIGFVDGLFNLSQVLSTLYSLAILLPSLAVGVRRLHDTGRSGLWLLIGLIPLIGFIVLLIFFCEDSKDENQYGPNPKLNS